MSISTTSGRSCAASVTAASPSAASPVHGDVGRVSRILRSPTRTSSWSSAMRTESSDRERTLHNEAAARGRGSRRSVRRRAPRARAYPRVRAHLRARPTRRAPSSAISSSIESTPYRTPTLAWAPSACLSAFVSASCTIRYAGKVDADREARIARPRCAARPTARPLAAARRAPARHRAPAEVSTAPSLPAQHSKQAVASRSRRCDRSARPSASTSRVLDGSGAPSSSTLRSAPAWTTIIETWWAITSCISRAIRVRSATTASRAARSRSRSANRSDVRGRRRHGARTASPQP